MLHSHLHHNIHNFLFPNLPVSLTTHHFSSPAPHLPNFLHRPTSNSHTVSAINPLHLELSPWHTKLTTAKVELGTVFEAIDDSSLFQVTFSVALSAAIAVFFFPAIQRRIKRAKQLKYRSSGVKKSSLNSSKTSKKSKKRPSPDQALLGAIIAGIIAVILYRFTTTIEASLYRQSVSDNFSVRQITITISNKWLVLPCNICVWHKLFWFSALFWTTCYQHLREGVIK
ncbi:uncharacterized protein LOC127128021 isoform X2 [Lathyrus oleraceus]|uniref:Transmembrane protein n=1 Tax=Pisum sativum TaxID=3888 RepID=A0A9D5GWN4_PEA|nr:uncharacterized protein LOC127128021 isoform X2 [Pisum sativum]KAI5444105.1 hypothetical protein KIW84_012645 [Pisum sativum]